MATDDYEAHFSGSEMDLILGFDPEVSPNDDLQAKLAEFSRHISAVQSIVDDAVVSW